MALLTSQYKEFKDYLSPGPHLLSWNFYSKSPGDYARLRDITTGATTPYLLACTPCPESLIPNEAKDNCIPCPENYHVSAAGNCQPCREGYFRYDLALALLKYCRLPGMTECALKPVCTVSSYERRISNLNQVRCPGNGISTSTVEMLTPHVSI